MNRLRTYLYTVIGHLFPFGFFWSVGGTVIMYFFLMAFSPVLFYGTQEFTGTISKIGTFSGDDENGGSSCFVNLGIKLDRVLKEVWVSEKCEIIFVNANEASDVIGKKVKLRVELSFKDSPFTKILDYDNAKVNNYYGSTEFIAFGFFLWGGLFLYIAYRDIKNEYKRQLAKEEKRKNQPPTQFNYDKY